MGSKIKNCQWFYLLSGAFAIDCAEMAGEMLEAPIVPEEELLEGFLVYSNPVLQNLIHLRLPESTGKLREIKLMDITGKVHNSRLVMFSERILNLDVSV